MKAGQFKVLFDFDELNFLESLELNFFVQQLFSK